MCQAFVKSRSKVVFVAIKLVRVQVILLVMMKIISVTDSGRGWFKLLLVKGAAIMATLMLQFVTSNEGICKCSQRNRVYNNYDIADCNF